MSMAGACRLCKVSNSGGGDSKTSADHRSSVAGGTAALVGGRGAAGGRSLTGAGAGGRTRAAAGAGRGRGSRAGGARRARRAGGGSGAVSGGRTAAVEALSIGTGTNGGRSAVVLLSGVVRDGEADLGVSREVRDPLDAVRTSILRLEANERSGRGLVSREDLDVGCSKPNEEIREKQKEASQSRCFSSIPDTLLSVEGILTLSLRTGPCEENRLALSEGSGGVDGGASSRDGGSGSDDGGDEDGKVAEHGDGYAVLEKLVVERKMVEMERGTRVLSR